MLKKILLQRPFHLINDVDKISNIDLKSRGTK